MRRLRAILLVSCALLAGFAARAKIGNRHMIPLHADLPLRLVQSIPLDNVEGRFDHLAVDTQRQHLFAAALGNNTLEIIDLPGGKRLHSVKGLQKPSGVAFAAEFKRIFVGNGEAGTCEIVDATTFARIHSVNGLPDADNVRYDRVAKEVYVGYGDGGLAVLSASEGKRLGTIKLAGHPESFQLEKSGPFLYVNVPSAGHIAVVDRKQRAVVATWPTGQVRANFPMALDEAGHRLFVGCRQPASVLIYDTKSGKLIDSLKIGDDTDDLFWDARRARLYVSCGEGVLNVFHATTAGFEALATVPSAAGARTCIFVPDLDRLYLAVPHRGTQRAELRVYATARPNISEKPSTSRP